MSQQIDSMMLNNQSMSDAGANNAHTAAQASTHNNLADANMAVSHGGADIMPHTAGAGGQMTGHQPLQSTTN